MVKEVLRYRPPAPMVPQVAMKPFKLTEDYTVRMWSWCCVAQHVLLLLLASVNACCTAFFTPVCNASKPP